MRPLVYLTLALIASTAMGKIKSQEIEPASQDIVLPVQTSQLKLEDNSTKPRPCPSNIEVGVSSWQPDYFARSTYRNGDVPFGRGSYPFISANYVAPLVADSDGFGFHWKLGFTLASLKRSVPVAQYAHSYDVEQKMTLVTVRLGTEWRGGRYLSQVLQPLLGFSVLPTLAVSPKSQIESDVSEQGYPLEAMGGVLVHPQYLFGDFWALEGGSMGVVAQYIFGSVGNSKMDGTGFLGFVRLAL